MTATILVFAGSNRTGAWSGRLADAATKTLALAGALPTRIVLRDYPLPIMDEDLQAERGVPEPAINLARQISGHDGLLIATPEYNGSLPPLLKNAIDWASRVKSHNGKPLNAFAGKPVALCSSSTGHFAGIRAIGHLRAILSHIGCEVVASQCSLPHAGEAFDEDGELREARHRAALDKLAKSLIERASMLSLVRSR